MKNKSHCIAASTYILMLLVALYCTYCAILYTLHSSQVMLWGLKRAMSGYLVSFVFLGLGLEYGDVPCGGVVAGV